MPSFSLDASCVWQPPERQQTAQRDDLIQSVASSVCKRKESIGFCRESKETAKLSSPSSSSLRLFSSSSTATCNLRAQHSQIGTFSSDTCTSDAQIFLQRQAWRQFSAPQSRKEDPPAAEVALGAELASVWQASPASWAARGRQWRARRPLSKQVAAFHSHISQPNRTVAEGLRSGKT